MTITDFTGTQLATILSALDGQTRNPASKAAALAAIRRHADELGCTVEDILEAAAGLLDGRMSADDFRAALRDEGATGEPGDDAATDVAEQDEDAPVAATAALAGERPRPATTKRRRGESDQRPARQRRSDRHRQRRFLADADDAQAAAARRLRGRRALAAGRTRPAGRDPARRHPARPARRHRAGSATAAPGGHGRAAEEPKRRAPTPSKPASSRCCTEAHRSAKWPASSAGCGIPATARWPG